MTLSNDCFHCPAFNQSVFSVLEQSQIKCDVILNSIPKRFAKGEIIYIEGTKSSGLYCIRKGKIKTYKSCSDKDITIGLHGPSDFFGYSGILSGGKYIASSKALENSEICFYPQEAFIHLIENSSAIKSSILQTSIQENIFLSKYVTNLNVNSMRERCVNTLLVILQKYGMDASGCLNITISRKEISELSGTTTESAIRILIDLKNENIISFLNHRIKIENKEALLRINKIA